MALANGTAQRYSHTHISPEQIVLGVMQEGSGVAANVLKGLGVDLKLVEAKLEATMIRGSVSDSPTRVPLSDKAEGLVASAIECARGLDHKYVGTEHLVLASLRGAGAAADTFREFGVGEEKYVQELTTLLGVKDEEVSIADLEADESRTTQYFPVLGRDGKTVIGKIPIGDNALLELIVAYPPVDNVEGIKDALVLRKLYGEMRIEYDEQPPRAQIVEALRSSAEDRTSLASMLERD